MSRAWRPTHQRKLDGVPYRVLGLAQCGDDESITVYESRDRMLFARRVSDFNERFLPLLKPRATSLNRKKT